MTQKLRYYCRERIEALTGCVQYFTLYNHCWFIRMLVIVAGCPRD